MSQRAARVRIWVVYGVSLGSRWNSRDVCPGSTTSPYRSSLRGSSLSWVQPELCAEALVVRRTKPLLQMNSRAPQQVVWQVADAPALTTVTAAPATVKTEFREIAKNGLLLGVCQDGRGEVTFVSGGHLRISVEACRYDVN